MSQPAGSACACHLELADSAPRLTGPPGVARPLAPTDALLLAWLALEGPTPREKLAALLWPEQEVANARNALRQRLFRLRRLGGHPLVTGVTVLALHDDVGHDLEAADSILGTVQPRVGRELGAWLDVQRAQRRTQSRLVRETRIDALETAGDYAQALQLAQVLLQSHPRSEDAHRRVMRLHYLRGDRAAALLAFDHCEDVLKHEVGASPSLQTLELLAAIEQSEALDRPPARPGQLPPTLQRPPRLIGRQAAIDALRQAWRAGSHTLLLASPGQGRTRLLQELAGREPGYMLARLPAHAGEAPFSAARCVTQALWCSTDGAADTPLARRLVPLLGADPATPQSAAPPGAVDWVAPVAELLEAAGVRVLAVDDVHVADTHSLALFEALAARASARWCFSMRLSAPGTLAHGFASRLIAAGHGSAVRLRGLPAPALAELLDSLGLPGLAGPHGEAPADWLHRLTGGNLQFTLEAMRLAWRESTEPAAGASGNSWPEAASLAPRAAAHLAGLSAQALELARLAVLAGAGFTVGLATRVLQRSPLELADAWTEAQQAQVLEDGQPVSLIVQEALRAGVPDSVGTELRARIAAGLDPAPD